jgi:3-oxoacyl-[acyl-carrier protein] reductase
VVPTQAYETQTCRRYDMLLEGKNAVVYGGGGSIGGAVARVFAREGANVYLAGRTLENLTLVAEQIRSAGGVAETARVDALDELAIDEHADAVAASAGGIDISVNLTLIRTCRGPHWWRWRSRISNVPSGQR